MDKKKIAENNVLESMLHKHVQIISTEGRVFMGVLQGVDQTLNVILSECRERVFSLDQEVQESELGLYMMRYYFFGLKQKGRSRRNHWGDR
jgi:small nuclear ribonucleoprotein (snRNP)-like protein